MRESSDRIRVKNLGLLICFMIEEVNFESPAYSEGETQRYSFDGEKLSVIAFFPGAFTSVCTEEMCELRDSMAEFEEMDVEVVGISVDTPFALKEFAKKNNLNFTLVSDTGLEIAENYGVITEIPGLELPVCDRSVFLIKDGEVVYEQRIEDPSNLPDIEKIKEEIRSIK